MQLFFPESGRIWLTILSFDLRQDFAKTKSDLFSYYSDALIFGPCERPYGVDSCQTPKCYSMNGSPSFCRLCKILCSTRQVILHCLFSGSATDHPAESRLVPDDEFRNAGFRATECTSSGSSDRPDSKREGQGSHRCV